MDRDPYQPLKVPLPPTVEEAKARLRVAAQNVTLGAVMGRRGWPVLAAAVAAGFLASRLHLPRLLGPVALRRVAPLALTLLLGRKSHCSGSGRQHSGNSSLKSQ